MNGADFAAALGLTSRSRASEIERGAPVSLAVALRIEQLSGGRIPAHSLNGDVAAARAGCCCDHAQPSAPAAGGVSALKNEPDFSGFAHDVEISGGVVLRDAPSTGSVLSSPLDPVEGASLRPQDERTFDEGLSA